MTLSRNTKQVVDCKVALVLGKPDAVIPKVEKVETLVTVDRKGKALALYDGLGITFLARRYGLGKNTKACRSWLESIGIHDNQWLSEPSLVTPICDRQLTLFGFANSPAIARHLSVNLINVNLC